MVNAPVEQPAGSFYTYSHLLSYISFPIDLLVDLLSHKIVIMMDPSLYFLHWININNHMPPAHSQMTVYIGLFKTNKQTKHNLFSIISGFCRPPHPIPFPQIWNLVMMEEKSFMVSYLFLYMSIKLNLKSALGNLCYAVLSYFPLVGFNQFSSWVMWELNCLFVCFVSFALKYSDIDLQHCEKISLLFTVLVPPLGDSQVLPLDGANRVQKVPRDYSVLERTWSTIKASLDSLSNFFLPLCATVLPYLLLFKLQNGAWNIKVSDLVNN